MPKLIKQRSIIPDMCKNGIESTNQKVREKEGVKRETM